jgi:hypothetical protein
METKEKNAIASAVEAGRKNLAHAIEQAGIKLEAFQTEHAQTISASALKVATLQSELELYEGLERPRQAAQVRLEIDAAWETHRAVVNAADARLSSAFLDYVRMIGSIGTGAECSFNSTVAHPKDSQS